MDWPLVFLRSFVVVSLGGCPTIGRADLAHTDGASDFIFSETYPVSVTDVSYDSHTAQMLTASEINEPLEDSLIDLWQKICAKGFVEIESAWKLQFLYKAGGAHWLTSVLVKTLLKVSYQDDLHKQTELLRAILHIDIEQTTLALLQHVIPQYLQCKTNREFLTDPRGAALAKV